jgi:hypothetical protein
MLCFCRLLNPNNLPPQVGPCQRASLLHPSSPERSHAHMLSNTTPRPPPPRAHLNCHSQLRTLKMRLKGDPSGGTLTYRLATAPAMNRQMAAKKAAVGMPKPTPAQAQHTKAAH